MQLGKLLLKFRWKLFGAIGASCLLITLGLYALGIAKHQHDIAIAKALVAVPCLVQAGKAGYGTGMPILGPRHFALSSRGLQYVILLDTSGLSPHCVTEAVAAVSRAKIGDSPINAHIQPNERNQ